MAFELPSKREAGVLMNPELNAEWDTVNKTVLSDGTEISINPPPPKPVMPDWSQIKPIRHYFNRQLKNNFWPAWLYNYANGEERIVKNADEAAELGVCMRKRTADEAARFGDGDVWDWKPDSDWRPTPKAKTRVYDPRKPEQGKEYIASTIPQATANRDLLNTVLPEVTAAVVAALKQGGSVNPNNIDPKQWDEFLAFQAWKKTQEAIDVVAPEMEEIETGGEAPPVYANKLKPEIDVPAEHKKAIEATMALEGVPNEREAWLTEAKNRGIKVDGRWSLDRLRSEVEKAA